ncbi:MAG: hypothetical protein M5U26_21925 [Planctomycetota bacterium]|nr:hypothetical protein [Planctomycetota bacterium]
MRYLFLSLGWLLGLAALVAGAGEDGALEIQPARPAEASNETGPAPALDAAGVAKLLGSLKDGEKPAQRLEAVEGLLAAPPKPLPQGVSEQLFKSALFDEDEGVRAAAARAMDKLDDRLGMQFMFKGALHPQLKANIRQRAAEGIRALDRPEVIQALVSIVTEELRVGSATEVTPPQTIFISNGLDVNNPLGNINLPIELPNLELRSVQTSVAVLALSALRTISRRDLGAAPDAWNKWFADWKHIREVRLAENAKR